MEQNVRYTHDNPESMGTGGNGHTGESEDEEVIVLREGRMVRRVLEINDIRKRARALELLC